MTSKANIEFQELGFMVNDNTFKNFPAFSSTINVDPRVTYTPDGIIKVPVGTRLVKVIVSRMSISMNSTRGQAGFWVETRGVDDKVKSSNQIMISYSGEYPKTKIHSFPVDDSVDSISIVVSGKFHSVSIDSIYVEFA